MWLGLLGVYLVVLAAGSLSWVMYQDTPIMLYGAFAVDRLHLVPYRDFFDNQMPGVYAANVIVGRLSQYTERGVRWVDLGALALLLAITVGTLRRYGRGAAWCAALYTGILYLASGEFMTLQREFLLLLPLSAATWVTLAPGGTRSVKALAVGVLLGLVATIKPQAAAALPILIVSVSYAPDRGACRRSWMSTAVIAFAGFALPLLVMLEYLRRHGAFGPFVDMAMHYWPLYNALSGSPRPHVILHGAARVWYIVGHTLTFGVHPGLPLLAAAGLGTWIMWPVSVTVPERRRLVMTLGALTATACISVAAAGKFYAYHWLPFQYFAILLAAQAWPGEAIRGYTGRVSTLVLVALLTAGMPWRYGPFYRPFAFPFARVDAIATYLSAHLESGDTVAPLDWTEGAVHAMLLARAPLGTPFLYDFPLYHHVSSPYVQALRRRVLDRFHDSPPRFLLRVPQQPFAGPGTSATFAELDALIEAHYGREVAGEGYEIWRRRDR